MSILDTDVKVDIAIQKDDEGVYDWAIGDDGDFVPTYGFDSSLLNSCLNEQRASVAEQPNAQRRRGWIGNETPVEPGFEEGSKLYKYYQARSNTSTRNGAVDEVKDGLAWLSPDFAAGTTVTGNLTSQGLEIVATTIRKSGKVDKVYLRLWELTGL